MMTPKALFLTGLLLAIGAAIRFVLVMLGDPVTPNIIIAFYCLAIIAVLPTFGETLAIGFIAGSITALISQSVIDPAFLVSEPLGAVICLVTFTALKYREGIAPYLSAFLATIASGIAFTGLALSLGEVGILTRFPDINSFLHTILVIILVTACINAVFDGLMYQRARNFIKYPSAYMGYP